MTPNRQHPEEEKGTGDTLSAVGAAPGRAVGQGAENKDCNSVLYTYLLFLQSDPQKPKMPSHAEPTLHARRIRRPVVRHLEVLRRGGVGPVERGVHLRADLLESVHLRQPGRPATQLRHGPLELLLL